MKRVLSAVFLLVHLAVDWSVRHSFSLQMDERILSIIQIILWVGVDCSIQEVSPNPNEAEKMHQYGQIAQLHYRRGK